MKTVFRFPFRDESLTHPAPSVSLSKPIADKRITFDAAFTESNAIASSVLRASNPPENIFIYAFPAINLLRSIIFSILYF